MGWKLGLDRTMAVLLGLALAGCSSETAKKPEPAASSNSSASRGAGQMGKAPASRQSSSGSSL